MITKIKHRYTFTGVYLTAKTDKGDYGQHYDMTDKTKPSFVPDLETARQKFLVFYNRFE